MQGIELPTPRESSLLCGETGVALLARLLEPEAGLEDDLHRLVRANVANEADDLMWGVPGTLVASRAMVERTGAERWREAWNESAEALLARRDVDGLWTQRVYGETYRGLGPAHGLVGNVLALLPLLDDERRREIERTTAAILVRTALVEECLANWPFREGAELQCSGAMERQGSSRRRRHSSTRTSRSRGPSSSGRQARTAPARAPRSVTAPRRAPMRFSRSSSGRATRSGSSGHAGSRRTRSAGARRARRTGPWALLALDGRPWRRAPRRPLPRGQGAYPLLAV